MNFFKKKMDLKVIDGNGVQISSRSDTLLHLGKRNTNGYKRFEWENKRGKWCFVPK